LSKKRGGALEGKGEGEGLVTWHIKGSMPSNLHLNSNAITLKQKNGKKVFHVV